MNRSSDGLPNVKEKVTIDGWADMSQFISLIHDSIAVPLALLHAHAQPRSPPVEHIGSVQMFVTSLNDNLQQLLHDVHNTCLSESLLHPSLYY